MTPLLDVLLHPSRWGAVEELAPRERAIVALVLLAATVVVAALAGWVLGRWARARGAADDWTTRRLVGKLRRGLVLLVGFVGAYAAAEVAPLPPKIERIFTGAFFVLGAFVAARLIIHFVALLLSASLTRVEGEGRDRLQREYVPLVSKITTFAVALILVVVVLKHFGQDVTSLVAALGVGSLAIGLAAQQTLGNMIAGFVLLVDRPFRVGDRIKLVSGENGEVVEIGVRSTRIALADRNLLIVPNTELVNTRVTNYAFPTPASRAEIKLTIAYGSDLDQATRLLTELAHLDARVAKTPEAQVRVASLGAVGIDLVVSFDVPNNNDVVFVEDALRRRILQKFAAENIALPFPRTDVHLVGRT